jgi:dihydropteroate synthase
MGILNITPDSFSDGGKFLSIEKAIEQACHLSEMGAIIIDIGAESSRPGAQKIDEITEKSRLDPILPALIQAFSDVLGKNLFISIDTYKPQTMKWALDLGVHMINDISGFTNPQSIATVAAYDCYVCIMHMQNHPHNMQHQPYYKNIIEEVHDFLCSQTLKLYEEGIDPKRMILDLGFGFGKTLAHNTDLINHLADFKTLDYQSFVKRYTQIDNQAQSRSLDYQNPLKDSPAIAELIEKSPTYLNLVGISNKSMIGQITNRSVDQRQAGNDAMHLLALQKGADILRVHDVANAIDVLKIYQHFATVNTI